MSHHTAVDEMENEQLWLERVLSFERSSLVECLNFLILSAQFPETRHQIVDQCLFQRSGVITGKFL